MRLTSPAAAVLALLHLVTSAAAEPQPTFRLGKYVKGTGAEIRAMLQGPVDEFTTKTEEAKKRLAECEAAIAAAREAAKPRLRGTKKYRELEASAEAAQRELERVRQSGTARQRLDASSRLNRLRTTLAKMETDAVASDPEVARLKARLAEETESVERCQSSLEKATAWRDQWVYAIECTFRIPAPVQVGSHGVLTTVKVLKPNTPTHEGVLVEYEAAEQTGLGGVVEGIQMVNVVMKKHRLLLAPETPGAAGSKKGDVLELFRTYRVESMTADADGPVYVTARRPHENDALMAEIMPLRKK